MALASSVFDTGITWEIKDKLAMLLERLTGEDLREQICRISFARDMLQLHTPSAAQLAHLEQLPIDVAGVTGSGIAMTQVVRSLAVCAHLHRLVKARVTHETDNLGDVE